MSKRSGPEPSEAYRFCNHHHELTDGHKIVTIGGETFVANVDAIPLLEALDAVGLKTRTHHIAEGGNAFGVDPARQRRHRGPACQRDRR